MRLAPLALLASTVIGSMVQADVLMAAPSVLEVIRAPGVAVDGQYIVVVADGVDPNSIATSIQVKPLYVYTKSLNGFAAKLSTTQLDTLKRDTRVKSIEQDQTVTADATQTMVGGQPWGLDRIDRRFLPLNNTYVYTNTGTSSAGVAVNAYVIDTGILTTHTDFGGRAANVFDAFGGTGTDCHGHGTHVAGTLGGKTYGVAKTAKLKGVRVLNCSGSGTISGVIAGVNYVQANAIAPAVANMSLGGGYSASLNTAVANLSNAGVFVAVAAGNSNANACSYSPASTPQAYTVAASTNTDAKASYSNWGSCVDGYAPGHQIKSDWYSSTTATNTLNGTSMASPHVAGCAALYKAQYGNQPSATVANYIAGLSTPNVITGNPTGTPNRLLYCGPDVWSQDKSVDTGNEPDAATASMNMWESNDIWNTVSSSSGTVHQNPEYGQSNYMHVKLRNRGLAQGAGPVTLYYANASSGLSWSGSWTTIGTFTTPVINPNATLDVVMPWTPPATGHFCILSRYTGEPMTYVETTDVNYNTRQNNNIVWRNMNVVDLVPGVQVVKFILRNILDRDSSTILELNDALVSNAPFIKYGEMVATLPADLYKAWLDNRGTLVGMQDLGNGAFKIIAQDAAFYGLPLKSKAEYAIQLQLKAVTATTLAFQIEAVQFDSSLKDPIGGVTYQIKMPSK